MPDTNPRVRKHFYNLADDKDYQEAKERVRSVEKLSEEADKVWKENGYLHIIFKEFWVKFRYRRTGKIFYMEWRTRHVSEIGV